MNEDGGAEQGEEKVVENQLEHCANIWASLDTDNKYAFTWNVRSRDCSSGSQTEFKAQTTKRMGVCCHSTLWWPYTEEYTPSYCTQKAQGHPPLCLITDSKRHCSNTLEQLLGSHMGLLHKACLPLLCLMVRISAVTVWSVFQAKAVGWKHLEQMEWKK